MKNIRRFHGLSLAVLFLIACMISAPVVDAADVLSGQGQTQASAFGRNPVQKLARGLFYIASSVLLIPREIVQVGGETEPAYLCSLKGPIVGGAQGVYKMLLQMAAGVFDIVTFPVPAGRDWKPLFEPETLFPQI